MKLWEILKLEDEKKLKEGDRFRDKNSNTIIEYTGCSFISSSEGFPTFMTVLGTEMLGDYEKIRIITLEEWKKIPIGTKVKYRDKKVSYGYFAGINTTGCLIISDIKEDDSFTGIRMDSYGVCRNIKPSLVELYKE